MTKKRLSVVFLTLIIVSVLGLFLKYSKIETPSQHINNAQKVTQVASKKEAGKKSASSSSKKKSDNNSKNSSNKENSNASTNAVASNQAQDNSKAEVSKEVSPSSSEYSKLLDNANKHTDSKVKDRYQTDPTPEGMPKPVEPQAVKVDQNAAEYCTLSIRCDTILNNKSKLKKSKFSVLPGDGVIYSERQVVFYKGESVFNVLVRETAKNNIQMDFVNTPVYNSAYIRGIHNLYEFDCGNLSGWMYKVNGWFPNYGCSRYQVKSGDKIEWVYTCDLGRDVGCVWMGNTK